jgi:hypothetical protein
MAGTPLPEPEPEPDIRGSTPRYTSQTSTEQDKNHAKPTSPWSDTREKSLQDNAPSQHLRVDPIASTKPRLRLPALTSSFHTKQAGQPDFGPGSRDHDRDGVANLKEPTWKASFKVRRILQGQ